MKALWRGVLHRLRRVIPSISLCFRRNLDGVLRGEEFPSFEGFFDAEIFPMHVPKIPPRVPDVPDCSRLFPNVPRCSTQFLNLSVTFATNLRGGNIENCGVYFFFFVNSENKEGKFPNREKGIARKVRTENSKNSRHIAR